MVEKKINDIVIVGAGPAGLTASIYAARAGLSAVVLDELGAGGQLLSIDNLENYPGFPDGINGFEVAYSLRLQAERFGAVIENDKAFRWAKEMGMTLGLSCKGRRAPILHAV